MDRLIYTSLTARRGSMSRQTAIANNLANAQTPGFRADIANAQLLWLDGSGLDARALVSEEVLAVALRAGTLTQTGDRKSAVAGSRVSVRVGLGGRRIINTKRTKRDSSNDNHIISNIDRDP